MSLRSPQCDKGIDLRIEGIIAPRVWKRQKPKADQQRNEYWEPNHSSGFSLIFAALLAILLPLNYSDLAASAQFSEHNVDTLLVNGTQAGAGNAQANETVFAIDPNAAVLQVRQEATLRSVIGMGNFVPNHRGFSRDLADSRHELVLQNSLEESP